MDRSVECAGRAGTPVTLDASAAAGQEDGPIAIEWLEEGPGGIALLSTDPVASVALSEGAHAMVLRVKNGAGLIAEARFTVRIADTTPPVVQAAAFPGLLWPPNHRLVPVFVAIHAVDACAGSVDVRLVSAVSSEPDDAPGSADGHTTGDIRDAAIGTDDRLVLLRAERSARGPGRVYTLTYRVADPSGNARSVAVNVKVPRGHEGDH